MLPIAFVQKDAIGLHYHHCDALVVRTVIGHNRFKHMVDNRSLVNILFDTTNDKTRLDHELTLMTYPLMSSLAIVLS